MQQKNIFLAVCAIAMSFTVPAMAADGTGFYVGADAISATHEVTVNDNLATDRGASFNQSTSSWSLSAGYRFNQYIALELAYTDLECKSKFLLGAWWRSICSRLARLRTPWHCIGQGKGKCQCCRQRDKRHTHGFGRWLGTTLRHRSKLRHSP